LFFRFPDSPFFNRLVPFFKHFFKKGGFLFIRFFCNSIEFCDIFDAEPLYSLARSPIGYEAKRLKK